MFTSASILFFLHMDELVLNTQIPAGKNTLYFLLWHLQVSNKRCGS